MSATTPKTAGRPKGSTNKATSDDAEFMRAFIIRGISADGNGDALAVRSTMPKAVGAAMQMHAETVDDKPKYNGVLVYQVRSGNVIFDASEDAG